MKFTVILFLMTTVMFAFCMAKALDVEENVGNSDDSVRVTDKGTEQDVEIYDQQGNKISTAELFLDEGYEVDKPENSTTCYVKQLSDADKCYQARIVSEGIPQTISNHCGDRTVAFLVPLDCEKANDSKGTRQKRWLNTPEVEGMEPDFEDDEPDCHWETVITDCKWVFRIMSNGRLGCFYECKTKKILVCDLKRFF